MPARLSPDVCCAPLTVEAPPAVLRVLPGGRSEAPPRRRVTGPMRPADRESLTHLARLARQPVAV